MTGAPELPTLGPTRLTEGGQQGDWLAGADGAVYGVDAPDLGSLAGTRLDSPVVGIAQDDPTGGYWLITEDGTVTGFDAPTPAPARPSSSPAVAILPGNPPTLGAKDLCAWGAGLSVAPARGAIHRYRGRSAGHLGHGDVRSRPPRPRGRCRLE
jgi:hypothetical protein